MCGRFTLIAEPDSLSEIFQVWGLSNCKLSAKYNIAPTQMVLTVLYNSQSQQREYQWLRWGLIPRWAKDSRIGARLINARAETLTEKPSFRSAFKRRRCLVLADGFYEWKHLEGKKQPYYFHLNNKQPFAFAGLWEQWQSPGGEKIISCTIVTTNANELLQPIHNRMPVILQRSDYEKWLDPQLMITEPLQELLQPYPAEYMSAYAVSVRMNNPNLNSRECIIRKREEN